MSSELEVGSSTSSQRHSYYSLMAEERAEVLLSSLRSVYHGRKEGDDVVVDEGNGENNGGAGTVGSAALLRRASGVCVSRGAIILAERTITTIIDIRRDDGSSLSGDDAILKSRTSSGHDNNDLEVATICSDMTSSTVEYTPLETVLEHNKSACAAAAAAAAVEERGMMHHRHCRTTNINKDKRWNNYREQLHRRIQLWYVRAMRPFWKLTLAQILCALYILILTFSSPPLGIRDPITNNIIDTSSASNTSAGRIYINGSYRPIVAMSTWQMACLAISRASAFSMYPMLVVVFVTKMKAIHSFLCTTPLSMYLGVLNRAHEFHVHAGAYLAFDAWLHTLFHILRWHSQGNIMLLLTSRAGLSGVITVIATTLVTFPMMYYKDKLSYEVRKGLHFLFYIVAVGLCLHVPTNAIPNGGFIGPILGSCIVCYTIDTCYVYFFMCEKIETTSFHVLQSGVQLTVKASDRFQKAAANTRGGYVYINIPWINDKQWHPFSLFEDPTDPTQLQVFLFRNGDWTNAVHKALIRDTTRPVWIKGPFPSPYTQASSYDNQILVASGVGITPALATISSYKSSRRINLIWAVRDDALLEYFLQQNYLDHDGWTLIFYTGQTELTSAVTIVSNNTNVQIIYGRPNLRRVIPNIIYGIESKVGLPEHCTMRAKHEMKKILSIYTLELDADERCFSPAEKYAMISQLGKDFGFTIITQQQHTIHLSTSQSSSSSLAEFDKNITSETAPSVPLMPEYIRRFSSEIAVKNSSSSWTDIEYDHVVTDEGLAERHWDGLKKNLINQPGIDALLTPSFRPWKENEEQEHFVKSLDAYILSTWTVMYCGGSASVIQDLQGISIDYNVDVHVDSFAW